MTINKIHTNTAAMAIARELLSHRETFDKKAEQLAKKHAQEFDALNEEVDRTYKEDFERLRLSLNIPNSLINPKFNDTYLKDFGELYLHHGPEVREASPEEHFLAKMLNERPQ